MITPPQNQLVFGGFGYNVADGKTPNNDPIKVVTFADQPSGLILNFVFTLPEFQTFL